MERRAACATAMAVVLIVAVIAAAAAALAVCLTTAGRVKGWFLFRYLVGEDFVDACIGHNRPDVLSVIFFSLQGY